ncbi:MAG TPA: S53 family peptidase [Terracidiphilus sp.]|nr:S53 family peptidase [Terracidiphilus sp.]
MTPRNSFKLAFFVPLAAVFSATLASAQAADRLPRAIDSTQVAALRSHHPQWASAANDLGPVPANLKIESVTLVLARSTRQEEAFEQLLSDQQNPASPEYHHWLTPDEIGERFGLSDGDIAAISGWLQSQGLQISWVSPSRIFLGFSGTAANVGRAFGTEFHNYNVHGKQLLSVSSDPTIPTALAPVIKSVRGLFTIEEHPDHFAVPNELSNPDLTIPGSGTTYYFIAPRDFATIYDEPASVTGAGTTIGIVAESRTNAADFNNFKSLTGTTFPNPTEVIPTAFGGADPGPAYTSPSCGTCSLMDVQGEATLDVLRAGSVAPGASLLLVVASEASGGISDDAQYLVQSNPVPAQVMSISFGYCELAVGSGGVDFWDTLFQQAAGEGISVFVSSGDSGASGCDSAFVAPPASPSPNSPNYICSSSYATCVGGTEFNDGSNGSTYWNSSNGTGLASARSYIPEGAWNEPLDSSSNPQIAATGGGVSLVIPTPSWQTGTGVPSARSGRYTPDVSFSASEHDGYFACFAAGNGSCVTTSQGTPFTVFAGTSAAAPGMAGVAALIDQQAGIAQGNLNPSFYSMAASTPAAFHQVSVASSGVTNCSTSTASMCNNSAPGPSGLTGGQAGFQLGQTGGYSEVTGLGSLDIGQFISSYTGTSSSKPTPTVSLLAQPTVTTAQSASIEITVTGTGGTPPTGTVTLSSGSYVSGVTTLNIPGAGSNSVFIVIPSNALAIGTQTLTAAYTSDSSNYGNASGSTTIIVTAPKPVPTITWATPAAIVYGTALSTTQLNATASVPGTFVYSPTAGTVFTAGTHTLTAVFTPTDSTDYSSAVASVTLTVSRATPKVTWATPAAVPAGTVLGAAQLTATASVPGTFTYTPPAGTLFSAAGTFGLSVSFAPADTADYGLGAGSVVLTVVAATVTPSVTAPGATAIAASSATLNAQVNANGSDTHAWFVYGTSSTLTGAAQTASQDLGSGNSGVGLSAGITGLNANTTYYFQAVAQNGAGTTSGTIQSFTTSAAPAYTVSGSAVTLSKGATTGDTSTITITPSGGFSGTVILSALVTNSPNGAQDMPTFAWTPSNAQVSVSGSNPATATLTILTTAATSAANRRPGNPAAHWYGTGGVALACVALLWIPSRRRAWRNMLTIVALLVVVGSGLVACGSGNNTIVGGGSGGNSGTTSGTYTITVTGTFGSTNVTTPVSVTVE